MRVRLLHLHVTRLVQEGNDGVIPYRLIDGIGVDQPAEAYEVILLFLHQRGACETEITRAWKHLPHPGGKGAKVHAVAFVYQQENIRRVIRELSDRERLVEFMNERSDDMYPMCNS